MYAQSARYYDAIYGSKDYIAECEKLRTLVEAHAPAARTLLDVGCGTGSHVGLLRGRFIGTGLDASPELLDCARDRYPGVDFRRGDMRDFSLAQRFDVVTCLFSAIGYMTTPEALYAAIANMARHLEPGGLMLVEPWLSPEVFVEGRLEAVFANEPDLKIARMTISERQGRLSVLPMHYMVATPQGVTTFVERHALGLYTEDEYLAAFAAAGLAAWHDATGLTGRGLYLARFEGALG